MELTDWVEVRALEKVLDQLDYEVIEIIPIGLSARRIETGMADGDNDRGKSGGSFTKAVVGEFAANGSFVPRSDIGRHKMLRDARMAGLVKLHCGKGVTVERQEWAVLPISGILLEQNEPSPLAHVDQAHRALAVC
jgi:hypothetical protein